MNDIDVINKIMKASKPSDVFSDDWKKEYVQFSKLIHPDACSHPSAMDAMTKLNEYKQLISNGVTYTDEAGDFNVFENRIERDITDDNKELLMKSYNTYRKIMSFNDKSLKDHFYKYLPKSMVIAGNKMTIYLHERSIPLTNNTLPQVHVNWIFSRMFEFNLWFSQKGYAHLGYNPTSVFVVPSTHGVAITSFYHVTKIGQKVDTISAKYKMWYPTRLFNEKIAKPDIDLELCKKTAIYLLGDKSASGAKLKRDKNVNQPLLTFLMTKHMNTVDDYDQFRNILAKNFKKKFYVLDL